MEDLKTKLEKLSDDLLSDSEFIKWDIEDLEKMYNKLEKRLEKLEVHQRVEKQETIEVMSCLEQVLIKFRASEELLSEAFETLRGIL